MKVSTLLSHVDHTFLSPSARWQDIQRLCDDALTYRTASVCIPPNFVRMAAYYMKRRKEALGIPQEERPVICTVIGFPHGYNTTAAKCFEAADAVKNGAVELDMVIDLGMLKDEKWDDLLKEIDAIKDAAVDAAKDGDPLLKVIVETSALTPEELAEVTKVVDRSKAEYIKTSTGFGDHGATFEDIEIMKANIEGDTKIKAAGGIKSLEDAEKFLKLGAERLGTSRVVKLVKEGN